MTVGQEVLDWLQSITFQKATGEDLDRLAASAGYDSKRLRVEEVHIRQPNKQRKLRTRRKPGWATSPAPEPITQMYPTLCGQYVPHHQLQHQQKEHEIDDEMSSEDPTCEGCILMLCDEGSYGQTPQS